MVNFSMLRNSKPLEFQHENSYATFDTFFGYIILFQCGQSFITSKVLSTGFGEDQLSAPLPPPRSDDSTYAPGSYLLTSASGWPFPYLITSLRLCLWVALVRIYYHSHQGFLQTMVNFSMLRNSKSLEFLHENGYATFNTYFGYIILFRCGQSFITSKVLSTAFGEDQVSA